MTNKQLKQAGFEYVGFVTSQMWARSPVESGSVVMDRQQAIREASNGNGSENASGAPLPPGTIVFPKGAKSYDLLRSFIAHCRAKPGERFWQALRNWAGIEIFARTPYGTYQDTFYSTDRNPNENRSNGKPSELTEDDLRAHGWAVSCNGRYWTHPEASETYTLRQAIDFQARANRMAERKTQGGQS